MSRDIPIRITKKTQRRDNALSLAVLEARSTQRVFVGTGPCRWHEEPEVVG